MVEKRAHKNKCISIYQQNKQTHTQNSQLKKKIKYDLQKIKNMKYLGINLMENVKSFHTES